MAEPAKLVSKSRTISIVAHASGNFVNLWASEDEMSTARTDDEVGRMVAALVLDEKHEQVPLAAAGGSWARAAKRVLEAWVPPEDEKDAELRVAVHLVVRIEAIGTDAAGEHVSLYGVIFPPRGAPVNTDGAEELGAAVRMLARDENQPRVRAESPSVGGDIIDGLSRGISALADAGAD